MATLTGFTNKQELHNNTKINTTKLYKTLVGVCYLNKTNRLNIGQSKVTMLFVAVIIKDRLS